MRLAQEPADELVVGGLGLRGHRTALATRGIEPAPRRTSARRSTPFAEVIECVETALCEPDLVGLRVKRPGAAQHDQLHLGDGVPHALVGAQAIPGLQVGIEAIVLGPLRARVRRPDSSLACERRWDRRCILPGHGYGFVSTVTGVTPLSVRIGRSLSCSTNASSSRSHRWLGPNLRKPAMISLREKNPVPPLGYFLRIRSIARESRSDSATISSMIATSSRR